MMKKKHARVSKVSSTWKTREMDYKNYKKGGANTAWAGSGKQAFRMESVAKAPPSRVLHFKRKIVLAVL